MKANGVAVIASLMVMLGVPMAFAQEHPMGFSSPVWVSVKGVISAAWKAPMRTASNWTSSGEGSAQVGHHDRHGGGNTSWNSAHPSRGCSQEALQRTGGAGLFYCFAAD